MPFQSAEKGHSGWGPHGRQGSWAGAENGTIPFEAQQAPLRTGTTKCGSGPSGFRTLAFPLAMPSPASSSRSGVSQTVGLVVFQGFGEDIILTKTTTPMHTWVAPQRRNAASSSSVQSVHLTSC